MASYALQTPPRVVHAKPPGPIPLFLFLFKHFNLLTVLPVTTLDFCSSYKFIRFKKNNSILTLPEAIRARQVCVPDLMIHLFIVTHAWCYCIHNLNIWHNYLQIIFKPNPPQRQWLGPLPKITHYCLCSHLNTVKVFYQKIIIDCLIINIRQDKISYNLQ